MLRFLMCPALGAAAVAATITVASAQQASVTLSPFVAFLPSGGPMAGLAFGVGGGPFALRAGAHMSTQDHTAPPSGGTATNTTTRPWIADADAIAYLEGLSYGELLTFAPYVFTGLSTGAVDSGSVRVSRRGWSYGSGAALPMGRALGLFGEVRWRMNRFVLPYAHDAPSPTTEARVGFIFRIGGGPAVDPMPVIPAGEGVEYDGTNTRGGVASRLISTADQYVGTRYRRGGATPSTGFDASGFVRFVFGRFGVVLPRTSRDQARVGERVQPNWHTIEPGDLVMFRDDEGISHVAIFVGQNRIIHSSESGGGVRYDDLSTERGRWFLDRLVAARRVTPDLRGLLLDLAREYDSTDPNNYDRPDHAPKPTTRRRR